MLKLRKDPTIPPSAATVTTATATAVPVSRPSLEARSSTRQRTSASATGQSSGPTSLGAASAASTIQAASVAHTTSISSGSSTGNMVSASVNGSNGYNGAPLRTGSTGTPYGQANGNPQSSSSSVNGFAEGQRRSKTQDCAPYTFRFDTNGALWALSASPDFSRVAVVGREGQDAKIATIGTNGPIVIWDIGTNNKIDRTIKEHSRAVHRICFSPLEPNLLLSASSDSTVRLWDLRTRNKPGLVMETKEIVREVQFNPVSTNDIMAGYESGNIQARPRARWDLRNTSAGEKKFMAHMGFVTSLDYHPNGRFLASGGRDKTIKVWDLEDDKDKRREIHTIPTIQFTSKVQWRPNKAYQLAASFKEEATVQVFDVRRPFVPLHVLTRHDKEVTTSILWKDADVIWTVSKTKPLHQLVSEDKLKQPTCFQVLAFTISNKGSSDAFEKCLVPRPSRSNTRSVALDGSLEATIYRTKQVGGVFDCELFNHEAFIFCAQNYSTEAGNVRAACEHNSNIAWQANKFRDSQTWMTIKLFYSDMAESAMVVSQVDAASIDPTAVNKSKDEQLQEEEDSDSSETDISRPVLPSLFAIKVSDAPIKRHWTHEDTIRNLLEYYAEQGEVQMCVTILLVLANEKDVPEFTQYRQWFGSYIDLLSRFKLWSIATAISQAYVAKS
ncbi:WD repeat-containing protein 24 [Mortierella sp. NVP85]|nr:WD repeat-containing protein 24 [Mortierella sp. NVP85]